MKPPRRRGSTLAVISDIAVTIRAELVAIRNAAVFGLGSVEVVHAQSTKWDSMLSNSSWYVPQENLLAYLTTGTIFTDPTPSAGSDQTLWSLGTATNGVFSGTEDATFRPADVPPLAITSAMTITSGIVTDAGQIRMTFVGVSSGQQTIGIGQIRTMSGTDSMQMRMITGNSSVRTTHWASMAKYDPNTLVPPTLFRDDELLSEEWKSPPPRRRPWGAARCHEPRAYATGQDLRGLAWSSVTRRIPRSLCPAAEPRLTRRKSDSPTLIPERIIESCRMLSDRVYARFPDRGLARHVDWFVGYVEGFFRLARRTSGRLSASGSRAGSAACS